jgi:hypothetical protein
MDNEASLVRYRTLFGTREQRSIFIDLHLEDRALSSERACTTYGAAYDHTP